MSASRSERIERIQARLSPLRETLLAHPIYRRIDRLEALHVFMQHHVFAVWDFMSLLKALQRRICCVEVPWLPPVDGELARFVNEIVLGEETDDDGRGGHASHFELYRRAMERAGAAVGPIDPFLARLRGGESVGAALADGDIPPTVERFVSFTFSLIASDDLPAIAAAFAFGREDLLPDVFQRVVDSLNDETGGGLDDFQFYLARHIELDGDHHGPLSERLVASLCGDDESKWRRAEEAAVESLIVREALWDGALAAMPRPLAA